MKEYLMDLTTHIHTYRTVFDMYKAKYDIIDIKIFNYSDRIDIHLFVNETKKDESNTFTYTTSHFKSFYYSGGNLKKLRRKIKLNQIDEKLGYNEPKELLRVRYVSELNVVINNYSLKLFENINVNDKVKRFDVTYKVVRKRKNKLVLNGGNKTITLSKNDLTNFTLLKEKDYSTIRVLESLEKQKTKKLLYLKNMCYKNLSKSVVNGTEVYHLDQIKKVLKDREHIKR
jgi:hypothetical protein